MRDRTGYNSVSFSGFWWCVGLFMKHKVDACSKGKRMFILVDISGVRTLQLQRRKWTIRTFCITCLVLQLQRSTVWIWTRLSAFPSKTVLFFKPNLPVLKAFGSPGYINYTELSNSGELTLASNRIWQVGEYLESNKHVAVNSFILFFFQKLANRINHKTFQINFGCETVLCMAHKLTQPSTGRRLFGSLGWRATMTSSATAGWSSKMADSKRCSSAIEQNYCTHPKTNILNLNNHPFEQESHFLLFSKPSFWDIFGSKMFVFQQGTPEQFLWVWEGFECNAQVI